MKIVASDYDGTLYFGNKISSRNLWAIRKWRRKGNKFGIVTGRSGESITQALKENRLKVDFLVCNNGGVVFDGDGNLLKRFEIDYDVAQDLMMKIRKMDCNSFVVNDGFRRAKEVVNAHHEDKKYGSYDSSFCVQDIMDGKRVCQIVISLNDDDLGKKIAEYINETYKGYVSAYVNIKCVDIVPYDISKADGLAYIEKHYGYKKEDIYAIGDSYNDLPMLQAFHSGTLHTARKEIIEQSEMVVSDVAEYMKRINRK